MQEWFNLSCKNTGWVNCWTVTDEQGIEQLERYQIIKTAQAEIDELFKDIESEIESGERAPDARMLVHPFKMEV